MNVPGARLRRFKTQILIERQTIDYSTDEFASRFFEFARVLKNVGKLLRKNLEHRRFSFDPIIMSSISIISLSLFDMVGVTNTLIFNGVVINFGQCITIYLVDYFYF